MSYLYNHSTKCLVLALFFCFCLMSKTQGQTLLINEFMAANNSILADEAGEYDDWIEIYNAGSSPVDLAGMYLSDGSFDDAWEIPDTDPAITTIPANGYLLIWADKDDDQGLLHADFKLSSGGETITLFDADEVEIDAYTFGTQMEDVSEGRQTDGAQAWAFFSGPTPESSNDAGVIGLIEKPIASLPSGHYQSLITVDLSTNASGAQIHYTLNGSAPDANSPVYTTPFSLDATTTLRAIAIMGTVESRIMTHTYLFGLDHDFAVVCLSTDDDHFFDEELGLYENPENGLEHPVHVEMFEPDGTQGFAVDAGVRLQGAVTITWPRKTLGIIMRSSYGDSKVNYPLFPELPYDSYDAFILRSSGQDFNKTMFRDAMASSLVRDMDDVDGLIQKPNMDLQHYRPTVVYLNGVYFGVHNIREKMDQRYIERRYDIDDDEVDIMFKNDDLVRGSDTTWLNFREFYEDNTFETQILYDSLQTMMDIDHYIDYILFGVFIDNTDWPGNNNRRYREQKPDAKWRWLTYDLDFGFGLRPISEVWESGDPSSNSVAMVMDPMGMEYYNVPWATLLLRKILENDEARTDYLNRAADKLNVLYNTDRVVGRVDEFIANYTDEIAFYNANFNNIIWDYPTRVDIVRSFAEQRTPYVWDDFESEFAEIVGQAQISISMEPLNGGTVEWSTLSVCESYAPFTGKHFEGITVPVEAKAAPGYVFSHWTGLSLAEASGEVVLTGDTDIVAHFVLGSTQIADVVINEINYQSADNFDSGDWIELYNNSASTVDLSAWYFEDESGEYFSLPANTMLAPDGYLVLVEDSTLFTSMYPTVFNFIGNFGASINGDFKLSNGGELIAIRNANNSFSDEVEYDNNLPWPTAAAGTGASLQLIAPILDNALPQSWLAVAPTAGEENNTLQSQSINFNAIPDKITTDDPFNVIATASSGLVVSFEIISGPASINGNTIDLDGNAGLVTVEATQLGDLYYSPAPPVIRTFEVYDPVLSNQSIDFTAIPDKFTGETPFDIFATASSSLAVSFEILSGPATIAGNTISLTGAAGTVMVQATQPGSSDYNPAAPVTQTFEVIAPVDQTISFTTITDKVTTDDPFEVYAMASSGLTVDFVILSGPASIVGNEITLNGVVGTVTIEATQAGSLEYNPAPALTQSFEVTEAVLLNQSIDFMPIEDKLVTDVPFDLSATANSGLLVTYSIVSGPAMVSGNTVTLDGAPGTVIIQADQSGDADYYPAPAVQRSFEVNLLTQTIDFEAIPDKFTIDLPFDVTATASSSLPVSFTIVSGPAMIAGNTITLDGVVGTVIVMASQAGDATYGPIDATQEFEVDLLDSNSEIESESTIIKVFPNPATDKLHVSVESELTSDYELMVYDALGRPVLQVLTSNAPTQVLDLRSLSNGIYFLHLIQDDHSKVVRFLKN